MSNKDKDTPGLADSEQARVQSSAAKVSLAVFGSRILGLIREVVFMGIFGPGFIMDAYYAAYRIPNLLRDLLAEGALSTAFVTTFSKKLKAEGQTAAFQLANLVLTALAIIMAWITLIGIIGAPGLMVLNMGFYEVEGKIPLTIELTRILFPFIGVVSLAAIFMGLLNSLGSFGIPACAGIAFNLVSITTGYALGYLLDPELGSKAIYGFAVGTVLGGIAQLILQLPKAWSLGYRPKFILKLNDPDLRKVLKLMLPAVIGGAAVQINVMVNGWFASFLEEGSVSWLYNAFRLMQLPIGMFGVAFATVTLPSISKSAQEADRSDFYNKLNLGLGNTFFLALPASVGLAVLAEPIIGLVYQRGEFTAYDSLQAGLVLQGYAAGLAAYAGIKVIGPAFYALDKPSIPVKVSLLGIGLNIIFNILFVFVLEKGAFGLALSTSLVALINLFQLILYMNRVLGGMAITKFLKDVATIIFMASIMGVCIYYLNQLLFASEAQFFYQLIKIFILIGCGATIYFGLGYALRIPYLEVVRNFMKRLGH
ncbi:MAG: murein biosynthesis integral membrane protein MurJ [Verrucomicrobiota bacterium]